MNLCHPIGPAPKAAELIRSPKHRAWIKTIPCVICSDPTGSDCAHIRIGFFTKGQKPGDDKNVPLCRAHHTEQHGMSESQFWQDKGLNPFRIAEYLWANSGDVDAITGWRNTG